MPLVRKSMIQYHLSELDKRYKELRESLTGEEPNRNIWSSCSISEDDYLGTFTEISKERLEYALSDFGTVLGAVKKLKSHKEKKLHGK